MPLLAIAAILLALLAGARRLALYTVALLVASVGAVTWILWVNNSLVLGPDEWAIRRFVGTPVLMLLVLTPLLLQRAWCASEGGSRVVRRYQLDFSVVFRPTSASWAIVLVGLLSFPGSAVVGYSGSGLPGGWPSFAGTAGCDAPPVGSRNLRVVLAYVDSYPEANVMRARARTAGLDDVETSQDGCGGLRVYVDDVPTRTAAQALAAEAQAAGLRPTVERDPDD